MNPLPPNDSREALEARITALILGELTSPDAAELEQRIAADPELVALRHRLQKAANLLREACASAGSAGVSSAPAEKLSAGKREVLLARFKTVNPPVAAAKRRRLPSWIVPVTLTTCVIFLAAALLLPSLSKPKHRSQLMAKVGEESRERLSAEVAPGARLGRRASDSPEESRRSLAFTPPVETVTLAEDSTVAAQTWDEDDAGQKRVADLKAAQPGSAAPQLDQLVRQRAVSPVTLNEQVVSLPGQAEAAAVAGKSTATAGQAGMSARGADRQAGLPTEGAAPGMPSGSLAGNEPAQEYAYAGRKLSRQNLGENGLSGGVAGGAFGGYAANRERDALEEFGERPPAEGRDWYYKQQNVKEPQAGQTLGYEMEELQRKDGAVALADAEGELRAGDLVANYDFSGTSGANVDATTGLPLERKAEERFLGDLTKGLEVAKKESTADKAKVEKLRMRYGLAADMPAMGLTTEIPDGNALVAGIPSETPAPMATPLPISPPQRPAETAPATATQNLYSLDVRGYVDAASAPAAVVQPKPRPPQSAGGAVASQPKLGLVERIETREPGLTTNSRLANAEASARASALVRQKVVADRAMRREPAPVPVPQPEVAAAENPFSTFSLNVSDVSFRLATTALGNGQMPDVSTIRSEEFVNAFDYRDPAPAPGAPVAMTWERARYPFAHNRDLLRIAVKTAGTGREAGRALNLVLLLDNSGSMERADRVAILREALRVLGTKLQPQDKLTVLTFSRTPMLRIDGVSGAAAVKVLPELEGLTPEGGTNLEEALRAAYSSAMRHYIAGGLNRVVLLTDGAANLGDMDPERLRATVEENRKKGIALDCFGIGFEGYDDQMLEALSRNGDGRYAFINTPEAAATEFAGKLAGALQIAASDVKVQVEFNPERVNVYRQIGYAKHQLTKEQFRDNTVDAAEIAALESGNALYTVELKPEGTGPIGTVRVRYKVPGTQMYREYEWAMPYTGNAPALAQSSPALRLAATAAGFAEWLVGSPWAGEVTTDSLISLMQGIPQHYAPDARAGRLLEAIRQAKSISGR